MALDCVLKMDFTAILIPHPPMHVQPGTREPIPAWFEYLEDNGGNREDPISHVTLIQSRQMVLNLIAHILRISAAPITLAGISQGGCLALDIGTYSNTIEQIITIGSIPIYCTRHRKLRAPWFSLRSSSDEIFPLKWASGFYKNALIDECVKEPSHGGLFHYAADFIVQHMAPTHFTTYCKNYVESKKDNGLDRKRQNVQLFSMQRTSIGSAPHHT